MTTRCAGVKRSFIRLVSVILVFALFISGIVIPGNVMKAEAAASVKWLGYTAYGTVWDVADNSRLKIRPEPGNLDVMSGSLANGTRVAIIGYTDYDPSDPWSPWYAVDIANTALKEPSEYTVGYVSGQFVDVPVTGVQVSTGEKTLKVGTSSGTGHSVIPPCATDRSVTWSSNNTSVATVDANGNVTAHAEGTAVITVRSNNGGHTASCTYTVLPLVSEITLDKYTVTTGIGKSSKVTATVNPGNAFDKSVSWSSNNTAVATVDQNGNITGKSVGTATITVTANDGSGKSASCTVTVDPLVSTVSLNKDSVTLSVGKTSTLTATVSPENAFDKSVSWSSSDNNVATVNENGVVTAKAAGTAIIKATANDGSDVYDTCVFYVRPLVSSITINDASLFLYVGQGETLSADVLPENALDKSVTWKSSDESVATIDQDGNITTLDDGEVTFSATANDGSGVSAECTYTIEWIPSGIVLSKNKSTLKEKKSEVLTALFDPIAVDREVVWSSSDESVATVDQNGKVTAVSAGTAIITATLTNGSGQSASCTYTVKALVRKIDVKKNPLTMVIGQTEKLTATISPKDVYDSSITWSSSDPTVATVDENGYVKAKSAGTVTITAAAKDGSGVVGTSTVVVNAPISWISIDHNYATIVKGNKISLVTTIYPSTATDKSLTWKTSDAKVATVDQNGVVTAVNGGTATITAMSNDGSGKYDTCKVTVIVLVEKITLNKDSLAMSAGESFDLNETVLPANATDKTVTWSSADPAMVMVGQDGTVLARSGGVVKVRATANDKSGVYAECTVTTNYPRDGWVANISQTSKLNIRKDHNTSSQIITKVSYATQLTVTAPAVDGWYPVVLSDGNRGYASADYIVFYKPETMVSTVSGKAPTPTAEYPKTGWAGNMKQTSNLNIRTSPNGSVIKSVAYATQFTVTDPAENGWYPVKLSDGRTGYASATYVVFTKPTVTKATGTNTAKPSSSSTNNKQVAGYPKTAWVGNMKTTSSLCIRSGKSTSSGSITMLKYATQLTVTGPAANGWYPVKLRDGRTGYASVRYIVFSKPSKTSTVDLPDVIKNYEQLISNSYLVTFNYGDGYWTRIVEKGDTVVQDNIPTKSGHTFIGWSTNELYSKNFNELSKQEKWSLTGLDAASKIYKRGQKIEITCDQTLYAVWANTSNMVNLDTLFKKNADELKRIADDPYVGGNIMAEFTLRVLTTQNYKIVPIGVWKNGEYHWTVFNGQHVLFNESQIGNLNFGYTGRVLYSIDFLLYGADIFSRLTSGSDDPSEDRNDVMLGYALAKKHGYTPKYP